MDTLTLDDPKLLLIDDDNAFRGRLALTLERRGFQVSAVASLGEARDHLTTNAPAYAVVDMKLGDGNGLEFVPSLRAAREDMRVVILTGFGNIATAVAAIKTGAVDYLAKPADPEDIIKALIADGDRNRPPPENAPPHPAAHPRKTLPEVGQPGGAGTSCESNPLICCGYPANINHTLECGLPIAFVACR
jgi:ActR/RegA family two-component response regulator